jgi:hypothetical protein
MVAFLGFGRRIFFSPANSVLRVGFRPTKPPKLHRRPVRRAPTCREIPCVRSEYHFVEVRLSEARSGAAALAPCLAHPTRGHTGFAKLMVWSFLVGFPERPGPDTLSRFVEQGTAKSGAEA